MCKGLSEKNGLSKETKQPLHLEPPDGPWVGLEKQTAGFRPPPCPAPLLGPQADAHCRLETSQLTEGLEATGTLLKPQSHRERGSVGQPGVAGRVGNTKRPPQAWHTGVLPGPRHSSRTPQSPTRRRVFKQESPPTGQVSKAKEKCRAWREPPGHL